MDFDDYINKMKEIQNQILEFLEEEEEDKEKKYQDLIFSLNSQNIQANRNEFKTFLHLLLKISKNHFRYPGFFSDFEKILLYFKNAILNTFPNWEIFAIFKGNKRLLLFLIKEKMLIIDQFVTSKLKKDKYNRYFFPEIKNSLERLKLIEISREITGNFEKNRLDGSNESYICELIRNDSIEDFITYCNQKVIPISKMTIKPSIYETNPFLIKRPITRLIEYAAFCGSIQIFRYLLQNGVYLDNELWLYAIHGQNAEIIHLIEENHVNYLGNVYELFKEAVKCHHNNIAHYIKDISCLEDEDFEDKQDNYNLRYFNYEFINRNKIGAYGPFDYCYFDHITLVDIIFRNTSTFLNTEKPVSLEVTKKMKN